MTGIASIEGINRARLGVYVAMITLYCVDYILFVIGGNCCFMILTATKSVAMNTSLYYTSMMPEVLFIGHARGSLAYTAIRQSFPVGSIYSNKL